MSDQKLKTAAAVDGIFEGQFARRFKREMWFPILVTVATMTSPLLAYGFTREVLPFVGNGFLLSLVFWGFSILSVQRDIAVRKYNVVVEKLDAVLENVDAYWTWCEDSQSYAVHFTKNPHENDPEETEEGSEDAEK